MISGIPIITALLYVPAKDVILLDMKPDEAVKLIVGIGSSLAGRLQMLDARTMEWTEIRLGRDPACPVCADRHNAHHGPTTP